MNFVFGLVAGLVLTVLWQRIAWPKLKARFDANGDPVSPVNPFAGDKVPDPTAPAAPEAPGADAAADQAKAGDA